MTDPGAPVPDEMLRAILDQAAGAAGGSQAVAELAAELKRVLAGPGHDPAATAPAAPAVPAAPAAWAGQHGQSPAFPGAASAVAGELLQRTDLESTLHLARLSDLVLMALAGGERAEFGGLALSMVLRRVDEDAVGPRDPRDSTSGRLRRICNYRGCRLAENSAYAAAKDHFDACIRLDPRFAPAFCNRARIWLELGDLAEARADCEAASAFDPGYPVLTVTRQLLDALALMRERRGGSYAENAADHGLLGYLRCYDRPARPGEIGGTLGDLPDPFDVPELAAGHAASEANHLGVVLGRSGRYQEADAALTDAIGLDPAFDRAYFNRGKLRLLAGNSRGAIADLTTYLDRCPGDADAYGLRAKALRQAGQDGQAADDDNAAALWSS